MKGELNTKVWHQRFGHLNSKSLKLLKNKKLVHGLPNIQHMKVCVEYAFGKQSVNPFLVQGTWIETRPL